jgi:hypothetical protein
MDPVVIDDRDTARPHDHDHDHDSAAAAAADDDDYDDGAADDHDRPACPGA